nr:GNAT family N-acetyltransferase [Thalassobacillus pellis]
MQMRYTDQVGKEQISDFFIRQWGDSKMVTSSGIYHCDMLDGAAIVNDDGEILGLLTYVILESECEIISLDSKIENHGIGSMLILEIETIARRRKFPIIKLITTNDNLHALGFYQKRGYRITDIYVDAVDKARKIKPDIPLYASNGIGIRDEILLEKHLHIEE